MLIFGHSREVAPQMWTDTVKPTPASEHEKDPAFPSDPSLPVRLAKEANMFQSVSETSILGSTVQLLDAEEEAGAASSMAELAAGRPLSSGLVGAVVPQVLQQADSLGNVHRAALDPCAFAASSSASVGMLAVQNVLDSAEHTVRPEECLPDDDSPKTKGRKRKAEVAACGPPAAVRRTLPASASPLEIAAEECRLALMNCAAHNKGKWSEVSSMKGALTRLQAKSDKLPDSMAAERLMDSRVSSLPDEYNKHVTVLLTMAEETLGWHAFNLSLNQAEAEHAIATMNMMRSRVAAARLEMAAEPRRIGKLLTNQAVQHEAQRKLECALLDGWGVAAGWQALFRSVKALWVAPSSLKICKHSGSNPDFEHPSCPGLFAGTWPAGSSRAAAPAISATWCARCRPASRLL